MSQEHSEQPHSARQRISSTRTPEERVGLLRALYERAILTWHLLWDRRVGFWPKLIPLLGLIYIISPADLLPAWFMGPLAPLGVTDDIGVLLLVLTLFVQAAPPDVVQEYLREMRGQVHQTSDEGEVIEGYAERLDE